MGDTSKKQKEVLSIQSEALLNTQLGVPEQNVS